MVNVGTFPKNLANLSASIVAEVTISLRSLRRETTCAEGGRHGERERERRRKGGDEKERRVRDATSNKREL